ncbi:MAG: fibronectin type III domain-containing protein [Owenweeksia sp.]|nr:fibronectin type III domain-containing protein [Owenweeksia sp.]
MYGCVACAEPTAFRCEPNVGINSVDLDWTENNASTQWEVSYGTPGFTPGMGTRVLVGSNPYTLSGLNPAQNYDIYVRSICGPGDSSALPRTAVSFHPLCGS